MKEWTMKTICLVFSHFSCIISLVQFLSEKNYFLTLFHSFSAFLSPLSCSSFFSVFLKVQVQKIKRKWNRCSTTKKKEQQKERTKGRGSTMNKWKKQLGQIQLHCVFWLLFHFQKELDKRKQRKTTCETQKRELEFSFQ